MIKKILASVVLLILGISILAVEKPVVNNVEATTSPVVWVHHSLEWWDWWWKDNCSNKSPRPDFGLLSALTFNWDGKDFKESMEMVNRVVGQERQAGFKVIPTLDIHIHRGYEEGKQFESWFDRDAWEERAKWLEAMVPLAHENKMAVDIEPYWEDEVSQRYPDESDSKRLAIAVKPFMEMLVKHKIKLYVFPSEDTNPWLQIASKMGVDIVALFESSYFLSDNYASDNEAYNNELEKMARQRKSMESAGMEYVPGFFETALKKPGFMEDMGKLGYKEVWVFIRRDPDVHKYDKLCLPEFDDLAPYEFGK